MAHENDWVIDDSIPFRQAYPKLIESINPNEEWLANVIGQVPSDTWVAKDWGELIPIEGFRVWTDGTDTYYSNDTTQYVFNKKDRVWEPKTWNGLTDFVGDRVWTDGTNIYYSAYVFDLRAYVHYILDKATSTWTSITWYGLTTFAGEQVWTDGENMYISSGMSHYILNKETSTWELKTWYGLTDFYTSYIWSDGNNTYYSRGSSNQYVLNKSTSTWEPKTWNGYKNLNGKYIWSVGNNIYYSSGSTQQYILDKETSTWEPKTWYGLESFGGDNIWTDSDGAYLSVNRTTQYELTPGSVITDIPYRLNFPEMVESINPHDVWVTEQDPDAPTSDIEFNPNYRYVKLEFDYTVALNTTLTSESATTDLPNSGINISRGGYYWWQRWLEIRPKTPVASRLYAAEFTIKEDNGLSDYYTNYLVQIDKGYRDGTIQSVSFNMEPRATGYTAEKADLSTNGFAYTSNTNTEYYNNSEAQVANLNNQVGATIILDQNSDEPEVKSGTVTCKLYYCFDSDESGYDALLAEYPNHATPYNPKPATKVPYRLDFPELKESIDINSWVIDNDIPFRPNFPPLIPSIDPDSWLIDDDIPYRLDFPPLIPSAVPSDAWLQDKGWDPRRPWPEHRSIIQKVQTIPNIPDVDWTKSMQQTFEFYTVDPNNWYDDQKLENIISCDLTHDLTSDKRGNASISVTEQLPESYIRTYLVVTQAGYMHKICLGTYLYMTSSDSFDGMKHNITMTGYTPMVELEEKLPPLGFHIIGITNRKHSGNAPMVTEAIKDIVTTYTRCEIENRTVIQKPLLNDFVARTNDNFLTVINNILNASSLGQYILTVDEWGTIIVKDKPVLEDAIPTYIYTDDNSSILLPSLDTNDDIYGIPNVVEVLYTGDKRLPAIRVIVKNEDPTSIVSIPARGREIAKRFTITNIAAPVNDYSEAAVRAQVTAQAERLLEAASTINKTISYSHGYCDVKVGDTVLINYERAGVTGIRAKVVSQRISCKPGCQVDEQAVYTKKLWNRGV